MTLMGTLGPAGSNHDWVARRYLAYHGLDEARVALYPDFTAAFAALFSGEVLLVLQVAVHPTVTETVARYREQAHLLDTFIAPSQPMAVLTREEVEEPVSLGFQVATRDYVDTTRWRTLVPRATTVDVAEGLLAGAFDSGITLARFAAEHPGRFRVEQEIGAIIDPWLVYGRDPVATDTLLAWPDSPAARLLQRSLTQT